MDEDKYIVGRYGEAIIIRRISPRSCSISYGKRQAWELAKKRAAPKSKGKAKRSHTLPIYISENGKIEEVET